MVTIIPTKAPSALERSTLSLDRLRNPKQDNIKCEVLQPHHARQIAQLHIEGINRGFISSLGIDFVTALYEAIAEDNSCFGLINSENDEVLGFVAFTTNIRRLYKSIIRKKGLRFAFMLATKMLSFKRIKRVLETLLYPNKVNDEKMDLPDAELLSIVISPKARRAYQATKLIEKGFDYCYNQAINAVKVMVAADNVAANKLYQRCGFVFATQIDSHGVPSNVYTAQTNSFNYSAERVPSSFWDVRLDQEPVLGSLEGTTQRMTA